MKLADIKNPTAVFFQPARYLRTMAEDYGVTVAFGPEVENHDWLLKNDPDKLLKLEKEWIALADVYGLAVVLKRPWKYGKLPANVVGFCHTDDEPNATPKTSPPSALKAEYDQLRALDPSMPIFLVLYGGAITSANLSRAHERQQLADYLALCDVVAQDVYPKNLNRERYKNTWPGDVVEKIHQVDPAKPVWCWLEMNDQQLNPPTPPNTNGEPSPDDILDQADDCVARGAAGIGWFATCQRGKYGWGIVDPKKGDSYWPLVNRKGESIAAQLDMVKRIGRQRKATPHPPASDVLGRVLQLEKELAQTRAEAAAATLAAEGAQKVAMRSAQTLDLIRDALGAK